MNAFLIPFLTILVTEIGDNSFLTLAYLASKSHKRLTVLGASMLAYGIMNTSSALIGHGLAEFIDFEILKWIAGLIFIGFGLASFLIKENPHADPHTKIKKIFLTTFTLILLTEILDRSNFATALFATQLDVFMVIAGVLSAHVFTALLAIELGKRILHKIPTHLLSKLGGLLFLGIGVWTMLS